MDIKIIVAAHKPYPMPSDKMYLPVQVGRDLNKPISAYTGDNTGFNISRKNHNYCELTALYWAWKNLKSDYIGLVHYRRLFCADSHFIGSGKMKAKKVMTSEVAERLLSKYDVVLPKKRHYWIETLKSHYAHTHYLEDLMGTRQIIARYYPSYLCSFDSVMEHRSAHMFNMFVMRRDILDSYSAWLFSILFRLEGKIDISGYSPYQARVFGYISELLLDVWLDVNKVKYVEMPVMFMEKQHWIKKIAKFLWAKFSPKEQKDAGQPDASDAKSIQAANIR